MIYGGNHTPNVAFRHLAPNSARIGYVTERGLFIKLQALIYDILPSTTAVFSYAIGSTHTHTHTHTKKKKNCQLPSSFFVGA